MANTINLAKLYVDNLQKIWKADSLTSVLENGALVRTIAGAPANEVSLPKLSMDGLGTYSKATGYAVGDVTLTWETKQLTQDRGRKFTLDAMDDFESMSVTGANVLAEFQRTQVIPEVDAYRFAKLATGSQTGMRAYGALTTGAGAVTAIDAGIAALDNAEVPRENRVLFVVPAVYQLLKTQIGTQRFYTATEGTVNRNVEYLDGMQIVIVPAGRFFTGITVGTNGYANSGKAINFMIVAKEAVLPVVKHNPIKIFTPEQNQDADGWVFNFRLYHDCFVVPNKANGIYVHTVADMGA